MHPQEQDVASFVYQQLLKVEKSLLVVDSLDSLWSEPDSDSGANDVVLRIVELLGSLYTVSLIITESSVKPPFSVDWTLLLSVGGFLSLKPDDALLLFRHGHTVVGAPDDSQEVVSNLLKATNYIPLAIKQISGLCNYMSAQNILELVERVKTESEDTESVDPLRVMRMALLGSPALLGCPEATRLLAILNHLPDGVPDYEVFQDVAAAVGVHHPYGSIVLIFHPQFENTLFNVHQRLPKDSDVDMRKFFQFINDARRNNEDSFLLLRPRNTFSFFEIYLDTKPSINAAALALTTSCASPTGDVKLTGASWKIFNRYTSRLVNLQPAAIII